MKGMPSRDTSDVAIPDVAELDLFVIMDALSGPARRSIVLALAERDGVPCGQFDLSIAKSTAARHFRVLLEAGLIRQRSAGVMFSKIARRLQRLVMRVRRLRGAGDAQLRSGVVVR